MRALLWVTAASFVLYNAVVLPPAMRDGLPSLGAYLFGVLFFLGPFAVLLVASALGLARPVTRFCAGLGALVLLLVTWLAATDEALFVVPALLITFAGFSVLLLLGTLVFRCIGVVLNRDSRI